jgi:histidine triad (HIT) family protein
MERSNHCVFCRIVVKTDPARIDFQDEQVTAFRDIHPVAPVHILIVPNRHIASINELQPDDEAVIGRLFTVARLLAEKERIHLSGYRLIVNTGPDAGQAVFHLHIHLIGGRHMRFPMG